MGKLTSDNINKSPRLDIAVRSVVVFSRSLGSTGVISILWLISTSHRKYRYQKLGVSEAWAFHSKNTQQDLEGAELDKSNGPQLRLTSVPPIT